MNIQKKEMTKPQTIEEIVEEAKNRFTPIMPTIKDFENTRKEGNTGVFLHIEYERRGKKHIIDVDWLYKKLQQVEQQSREEERDRIYGYNDIEFACYFDNKLVEYECWTDRGWMYRDPVSPKRLYFTKQNAHTEKVLLSTLSHPLKNHDK